MATESEPTHELSLNNSAAQPRPKRALRYYAMVWFHVFVLALTGFGFLVCLSFVVEGFHTLLLPVICMLAGMFVSVQIVFKTVRSHKSEQDRLSSYIRANSILYIVTVFAMSYNMGFLLFGWFVPIFDYEQYLLSAVLFVLVFVPLVFVNRFWLKFVRRRQDLIQDEPEQR